MKKVIVVTMALTLVLGVSAFAGDNVHGKIAIHLKAHPTSCTKSYPVFTNCAEIVFTWGPTGDFDFMPVFYDLVSWGVLETGVIWPEAQWLSASWIKCKGDVAVGSLQHSADTVDPTGNNGTAIGWSLCQTTWAMAPGVGWLYATGPGMICPAPNPVSQAWFVVDCNGIYDVPSVVSCAGVGGMVGDDPCRATVTDRSTWGAIKGMFR
jgi:hypothetical protein